VFGRDMIHNIAFRVIGIKFKSKNNKTNKYDQKEIKGKIPYDYKIGDHVLLEIYGILQKL
jgi:hypothetical protein